MSNKFYITTPIYYVNDVPHIGHTYTTIAADTIARYKRMCGFDTYFLTGVDEHGQKIEYAAKERGIAPIELANSVVSRYNKLWAKLGISHDDFIRTTEDRHKITVQHVFEMLQKNDDIYEGEYEGWYCTPCESFWTESQLMEGNLCPDCGRPTLKMKEPTYFFRMSKYQDKLLQHIENNPNFIRPESRKNEVVSFVKEGLRDLSVSRVTFSWGVPVKNDPKHTIYVWVDALVNYISALGYSQGNDDLYKRYWPATFHLVGKDIIRFHSVYWPTILIALGLPLPESVFAHGWWTVEGEKMSKSKGNVVDPIALIDRFGVDQVRFFLLREVTFGLDGDFSYRALIHRVNNELANDLGNLATRTLGMVGRYFGGTIPANTTPTDDDLVIKNTIEKVAKEYDIYMNELAFNKVLFSTWELVSVLNKYIDDMQPWALAKDETLKDRLGTILYNVCDGLRALSIFINPFMPTSSLKLREQLGIKDNIKLNSAKDLSAVGTLQSGGKLGEVEALFPRLDAKAILTEILEEQRAATKEDEVEDKVEQVNIDQFMQVGLVAAKVEAAEKVEGSKKLLKLSINDGKHTRVIVSGISESYAPEELVNKTVVIVGNLKPAKLMGIESNGMLLSAFDGKRNNVIFLPDNIPAGTPIK